MGNVPHSKGRVQFKIITVVKFGLIKMLLKDIKLICNNYIITAEEAEAIQWSGGQLQQTGSSGSWDSETKIGLNCIISKS